MVQCDPVTTIDLSDFATRKPEIIKKLMAAASDIGFFRVKGLRMHWSYSKCCTALSFCLSLFKNAVHSHTHTMQDAGHGMSMDDIDAAHALSLK